MAFVETRKKKKRQFDYGPCLALIITYCVIVFLSCTLKVVNTHFFRPLRQSGPMAEHGQLTGLDVRFDFFCSTRFFLSNLVGSFRPLTTRGKGYEVGLVIRAYCEWGGEANQETPPPQVGGGSFCGFVAVSVACLLATKVLDGDLGIIFCTSSERHKIERKKNISARRAWGSGSMH